MAHCSRYLLHKFVFGMDDDKLLPENSLEQMGMDWLDDGGKGSALQGLTKIIEGVYMPESWRWTSRRSHQLYSFLLIQHITMYVRIEIIENVLILKVLPVVRKKGYAFVAAREDDAAPKAGVDRAQEKVLPMSLRVAPGRDDVPAVAPSGRERWTICSGGHTHRDIPLPHAPDDRKRIIRAT
jgi:hypothetical protein